MSFTVKYRGVEIECATIDNAIELAERLAGDSASVSSQGRTHSGSLELSRYREFVGYLNQNQKRFLGMLIQNPHGKTDRSVRQELGVDDNMALGGILSGVGKFAKKVGVSVDSIYTSKRKKVGVDDVKEFCITPEFLKIAADVGL